MKRWLIVVFLVGFCHALCWSQADPDHEPGAQERLQQLLIPPDLIMRHRSELQLSEEQEKYIREQVLQSQARFTDLRWNLQTEMDTLLRLLGSRDAQEDELTTYIDRVLELEREMKKARFLMAYRIKKQLTDHQLEQVERFRRNAPRQPLRPGQRLGQRP